ncbi:c-type cytochrome domain-containing protein [Cecembia rubra]|uniref:c-type cytochrome domain-containing protein n=1 Tax=Cecembia rubra TaxID=1485585 RepID=UPI0027150DFF|nr:c-type cytochrome domain-containing protein [Cecembia rubra]
MNSKSLLTKRKNIFIKFRYLFLLLGGVLLLLPTISPGEVPSNLIVFLGRLHPLVVHFPIVLIFLALFFELITKANILKVPSNIIGILLGLGILSCLGSLLFGFFLYYTGEYSGDTLYQHYWGGVFLTVLMALTLFLFLTYQKEKSERSYWFYFLALFSANVVLVYTGHQGGSLTHGGEYLTQFLSKEKQTQIIWEPKPIEEMLVYGDVIVAFLDKKCMSCHNENKSKGGLILTTYEDLVKGGKGEHATLIPNSSEESDIFRRVSLPSNDDDFMPPEGKPPLSQNEVLLLKWWIDNGADPNLRLTEASSNPEIEPLLSVYLTELEQDHRRRFYEKLTTESLIQSLGDPTNFELKIDPFDEKSVSLSMTFPPTKFGDTDLIGLKTLFPQISKASFIGSDITDNGFYYIGQMASLNELYIQQTQINGEGLAYLSNLEDLEILDLSKTNISNGNLLHILRIPSLKEVYIYETNISKEIIEAIQENRTDLKLHLERGKLF